MHVKHATLPEIQTAIRAAKSPIFALQDVVAAMPHGQTRTLLTAAALQCRSLLEDSDNLCAIARMREECTCPEIGSTPRDPNCPVHQPVTRRRP